jgi:hypothetical protein
MLKHKNDGGYLRSMSVLALVLESPWDGKPRPYFFDDHVWSIPFRLELAGAFRMRANVKFSFLDLRLPTGSCLFLILLRIGYHFKIVRSAVVHKLWCLISSGNTTLALNSSWNGVKLVALQTIVLWLHTALGITLAHLPFFSPSRIFLIASNIITLALSTTPVDYGWYTDTKATFILTWW